MNAQTINLGGMTFSFEVVGEPSSPYPAIVALHGWGGSLESMSGVAEGLAAQGFQVHSLDLAGFGRSDPPSGVWGVDDYARQVNAYLEQSGLKQVNLIGHSFGGRISIVLGADYPTQVSKIVLTDSAGVINPPTARDMLVKAGKAALKLPGLNAFEKQLRGWGQKQFGSADLKASGVLEPTFRKVITEDLVPRAAKISAPTLLIWGDQDQDTPLWQAKVLEQTIPDAGLVVFAGAGHFAYQERLPDFLRITETFFKG